MTYDLVKMFRHYCLPKGFKWYALSKQCKQCEEDIANGVCTELEYTTFLAPHQSKLATGINISLRDVMKQTNERYAVAHTSITDVDSQEAFLDTCRSYRFEDADVQIVAVSLIAELEKKASNGELENMAV